MSAVLSAPLPAFDRNLLRVVGRVVPIRERSEWSRTWRAELWHMHHRSRGRRIQLLLLTTDLSVGLTRDALWLRTESWRRTLSGTPTLCLAVLLALCLLSTLIAIALTGGGHPLSLCVSFSNQLKRSLIGAPLVVFVTFATVSRRHIEQDPSSRKLYWCRRQIFFAAKTAFVMLLSFLLSADLWHPIYASLPNTADLLQILSFVILALLGLRWAFRDQEQRCEECLHLLATPARVGRPSHNLLEWNGTELLCKQGHGLLSIPEMETSWCQSSKWIGQNDRWDQVARN